MHYITRILLALPPLTTLRHIAKTGWNNVATCDTQHFYAQQINCNNIILEFLGAVVSKI